jgi:N-acetylglucosaminyldiphosphoundecaprenol N-acetyl-beta-D-mannosaminyltransferase
MSGGSTQSRVNVLGVGISSIDMDTAVETIDSWIASGDRRYVTVTGVHGVMECQADERLRAIHNSAGMVTPDGMPMVWIGRWRGHRQMQRVYGPDLMAAVCARSPQRGYRHFFYGGAEGVPERLSQQLCERYPGLTVVGTHSPPFQALTPQEEAIETALINEADPDIIWVGLSTPKQERWMAAHRDRLSAPVLIGVGAAFDIHSGLKPEAPKWVQRSGFQWLFRLALEPRRLWRRYLVNNPMFLMRFVQQELRLKQYSLEPAGQNQG